MGQRDRPVACGGHGRIYARDERAAGFWRWHVARDHGGHCGRCDARLPGRRSAGRRDRRVDRSRDRSVRETLRRGISGERGQAPGRAALLDQHRYADGEADRLHRAAEVRRPRKHCRARSRRAEDADVVFAGDGAKDAAFGCDTAVGQPSRDGRPSLPAGDLRERHALHVPKQPARAGRIRHRHIPEPWADDASGQCAGPGRRAVRRRPGRDAGVRAGPVVERGGRQQWAVAEFGSDPAAGIGDRVNAMWKLALLLLCVLPCRAQLTLTTIQDTLYNLDGSPMNGNIIVTNAAFSVGGVPIAAGRHTFDVVNGVVNIQLAPTDHASPAVAYNVNTVSNGRAATSLWSVPTLPSSRCPSGTCTIAEATTLYTPGPTTAVAVSQLSTQGASNGQMVCDTAGVAGWCNPPASGVISFNGRTGAVAPTANDYNFNQLAGTASVGQIPAGIPAVNIGAGTVGNTAFGYIANLGSDAQAQLNARLAAANNLSDVANTAAALSNLGGLPKGTVATWIDQYCATQGVYDQTCFSAAFTAAGSASNVTFMLGPNTYTFSAGVTISSKTGWTIVGLKDRSKIRAANGANAALFTLNGTTDFAMRDVFVDGNYQNQTSEISIISATNIVGLILQGNRFTNVKGRAVVVSNSAYDFNDGVFISNNIISGTTDSALYLALRYD